MKLRLGGLQSIVDKAKKPVIIGRSYSFTARSVQKEINDYELVHDAWNRVAGFRTHNINRVNVSIPFSGALYDTISDWMWSRESATISLNPCDFSTSFLVKGAVVEEMQVQTDANTMELTTIDLKLSYNTWEFFHGTL